MFLERWYQNEAAEAAFKDVISSPDIHPVIAAPTGSGKTPIICKLIEKIFNHNPFGKILVLSHSQSIVEQDHLSLEKYFDGFPIGLYAAGLESRIISSITVAQIQSAYRKPDLFKTFTTVIIDEAHAVTTKDTGMYRKFLAKIKANYIGLTATPFRTGHGYIYKGEDALFNKLSYDLTNFENFNRLIDEGFLCNLIPKRTELQYDRKKLTKTVAGDFSQKQSSEEFGREEITQQCVLETIHYGKKLKKWLCFAIDIKHAELIKKLFEQKGIPAGVVHSKMEEDFKQVVNAHKNGDIKVLVNVDMLTTGYDDPEIDLIAMMRPTKSLIIHVQTMGRGSRVVYAPGYDLDSIQGRIDAIRNSIKPACLVLDFAHNTNSLGLVNALSVKQHNKKGGSEAVTKLCPECDVYNPGAARHCINCGHEFVFKERLKLTASTTDIIKRKQEAPANKKIEELSGWVNVSDIQYKRYNSNRGNPDCLMVVYKTGMTQVKDFIPVESTGKAKYFAKHWINFRWNSMEPKPNNLTDLMLNLDKLKKPKQIKVKQIIKNQKFYNTVVDAKF